MQDNLKHLLPVSPLQYYILLVLVGKTLHGYQIMQEVEKQMGKATPTATLYRILRRMLQEGLIEIEDSPRPEPNDPRRRYYRLTNYGQRVFKAQTHQYRELTKKAEKCLRGIQGETGPAANII